MNKMIYFALTAAVAVASLLLVSCNDKIDVNREYDFALSCWHLPSEIVPGERVEIRFTLTRQGDFKGAEYYIGYIQLEGKGEVRTAREHCSSTVSCTNCGLCPVWTRGSLPPGLHALLHGDNRQAVRSQVRCGRQFRHAARVGGRVR